MAAAAQPSCCAAAVRDPRRPGSTVGAVAARCPECGADTELRSCEELFHALLALDQSREPPWGEFHAVAVACYFLQHPSTVRPSHLAVQRGIVAAFRADGLAGVHALTATARARNSHRTPGADPFPDLDRTPLETAAAPGAAGVTIRDVAVDGTFPALGHAERMAAWAAAVHTAWSAPATG